jgi:phosphoglycerate kinase
VPRTRTRTLGDLGDDELRGRRVLARMDYNVPLDRAGEVADPMRVEETLPTLERLRKAGARTILVSHLGRPDGAKDARYSLEPVARLLSRTLGVEVPLLEDPPGSRGLGRRVEEMVDGDLVLLENIRFLPGETANDEELGQALGALGDVFLGDAFGTAHRAHASNVGVARVIRRAGGAAVAGLLMERELRFLREAVEAPERPFVAILGGAKISGKIDVIEALLPRVDRLLVGGAMANTFFRALGLATGDSLVEEERVAMAGEILERAGDKLLLPVDCVVASELEPDAVTRPTPRDGVEVGERIGDIGPGSRELFRREILDARTCLWNGPMGVFEVAPFAEGTRAVARALAEATDAGATSVVGGGDSAAAAEEAGVSGRLTHVSTGGGASLELLAGAPLPGVDVLDSIDEDDLTTGGDGNG